ncbi:methyltransferase domain protein [Dictyocaulus viviparus]|uniref:Methyltransferase domain protein n=1 Tax=Dictyocaulus viviparus TaxID=29172 RepID=A0A0D8XTC5_DICVI|nr:methyltransferase domain protein [Dictyocaulus viviparus]
MSTNRGRPEHSGPPELYYNAYEVRKYASSSHIVSLQTEMAERAVELLALPDGKSVYILDIGCGTGISGGVLASAGHYWVGLDISKPMLDVAIDDDGEEDRGNKGDFVLLDIGTGLPFLPGTFDGAISISAIQWLFHANSAEENPKKRIYRFFQMLYGCLARGTRAVFQFYPENEHQSALIMSLATKAGFSGGLVVDYPNSVKAKKFYLVLMTGGVAQLPRALTYDDENNVQHCVENKGRVFVMSRKKDKKPIKGSKEWIQKKRERMIKQGRNVRHNSKYSGRKRKLKF